MTTTATNDDRHLLQRYARTGDADAFTQLVQRYVDLVYSVCLRVTGSRADAEDVTQECLLDLARHASDVHTSVGGYLHTVATRRSLMLKRSEGRRTRRESACTAPDTAADPTTAIQIADAVDEALEQLDPSSRDVVIRRYLQAQSQQDIAEAMGVDQSTVSRRLADAIETMRQHLGPLGITAGGVELAHVFSQTQPPAELLAAVTKIGLSGVGRTAARAAVPASLKLLISGLLITGAAVIGYSIFAPKGRNAMTTPTTSSSHTTVRPDLKGIHLSGFGMTRDSVSVAFQAAAKALGKDADYNRLYLLSGNAFAPAINTAETCRSWWHVQAHLGTQNLPAMAASVGLSAARLPVPALPDTPTDQQFSAARRSAADLVLKAMDSGAIVITEGGWDEAGAWIWSGVITDIASDGTLHGAALSAATGDGKENVTWKYPGDLWAIRPATAVTPAAAVEHAILQTAVDRIRGTGSYSTQATSYFGQPAMDQWILSMQTIRGFCPDCFKRAPVVGVQDAPDNDKRMYEAARIVATQLRADMPTLPSDCKAYLEKAAACYDRIVALLAPGATGRGGFTYDSLSSLQAQRNYVTTVLNPVKTELDWAALHIERALAIADGAKLNTALFPTYDQFSRDTPDANALRTNHLARIIAARAVGRSDVEYDDLIMLQGMGNAFAYDPKRFSVMYQLLDDPEQTATHLAQGTGFDWQVAAHPDPDAAWQLVTQCVDAQTPLVASWFDDFFIAGYIDAPQKENRRIYTMGRWSLGGWIDWREFIGQCQQFGRFAYPTGNPVPKVDMTRFILQRIVQCAQADPRQGAPFAKNASFGFAGMEAYAADIADPAKPATYFDPAWQACHAINRQWHARESAANWLARVARNQPATAADHLNRASALYRQSHDLWLQFRTLLTPEPGQTLEAKWSEPAPRQQGAQLIRQAIALEKQAADQIALALPLLQ